MKIKYIDRKPIVNNLESGVIYEKDDGVFLIYNGDDSLYVYTDKKGSSLAKADIHSISTYEWFVTTKKIILSN